MPTAAGSVLEGQLRLHRLFAFYTSLRPRGARHILCFLQRRCTSIDRSPQFVVDLYGERVIARGKAESSRPFSRKDKNGFRQGHNLREADMNQVSRGQEDLDCERCRVSGDRLFEGSAFRGGPEGTAEQRRIEAAGGDTEQRGFVSAVCGGSKLE